jgi:hypothetical protein
VICYKTLHPYIKSGMRLARGSSTGVTEVPRIGRVGSSRNERVPPCSSDVPLVDLALISNLSPFSPYCTSQRNDSTPDRSAQTSFEMVFPTSSPSAEIICHRTSVYVISAPAQRVIQEVQVRLLCKHPCVSPADFLPLTENFPLPAALHVTAHHAS